MTKRKRRQFTAEFKADAVKLVRAGGRSIGQVAKDLDLTETALRDWVRRAEIEDGEGPPGALTQIEREELVKLRRENKRLQMEREILKKWSCAGAHPRRDESGKVVPRVGRVEVDRLLVPEARKKMDPSAASEAPRIVAHAPTGRRARQVNSQLVALPGTSQKEEPWRCSIRAVLESTFTRRRLLCA